MQLRRRSRAEDMEAFQVSERCVQDQAPPVPEALLEKKKNQGYACSSSSGEDSRQAAQLSQLSSSPDLVVSCAAPVSSASQTVSCPLSSSFSSDPVIVHQLCPDTSKRNGLSLPRLEALGFVVTRRSRTLSLDDFSRRSSCGISASAALPAAAAAMKTLTSKDDSCLPFISDCSIAQLKKDLIMAASAAVAPISASKRFLSLADRSQSFDLRPNDDNSRRFYDLVGSPAPKFLLRIASQKKDHQDLSPTKEESDDDEAKSASRKCAAAVPFKWEEAPGKPKAEALASQKQQPDATTTLQLPPRLAIVSFNANRKISRARSVNRRRGGTDDKAPSLGGASSPRSTLCGPDLSSDTTSDSSALESDQAVMVSDAESATPNWQPSVELQMSEEKRKSFAARILHPEWLRIRRRSRKNSRGGGSSSLSQEWTPAMAAYFQSLDADSSEDFCSKKDDHQATGQQLLLLDHAHAEDEETLSKINKSCNLEPDLRSEGGIAVAAASDQAADGIMYCGCASPSLAPFSPSSRLRSFRSNSGKQKKRMVMRIRRSSRLLQMFVIKAVKQAVHPRRSKDSSKLLVRQI